MSEESEEPADAAAEAFEGVRADLAKVMAMLDAVKATVTVDYSPTLGKIVDRLTAIEKHPAMLLTPVIHQQQIASSIEGVRYRLESELQKAVTAVSTASVGIDRAIGAKRERDAQRNWVLGACTIGFVAGLAGYALAVGPAARLLPASWHAPEALAAKTLNKDFWSAGAQLMQAGNPSGWTGLLEANTLHQRNLTTLAACFSAATRTGKPQRCTVIMPTETQTLAPG